MPDPYASQFGFAARGTAPGQGDGDGMIAGFEPELNYVGVGWQPCGEPQVFWVDLSAAGLIEGGFHTATPIACPNVQVPASGVPDYYPRAKLGNGLYVYTASAYMSPVCTCASGYNRNSYYSSNNFFALSQVQATLGSAYHQNISGTGISVSQAYNIDKKIDDGLPLSGKVIAAGLLTTSIPTSASPIFANLDISLFTQGNTLPSVNSIPPSATTCYDNNNSTSNPVTYSISQNGGAALNCALSFQFQ